jgi:predicted protein tyrosine phosphatase
MKIVALPQKVVEKISGEITIPHATISIVSPGAEKALFANNIFREAELHLKFYDIDFSNERMGNSKAEILKVYGHGKFTDKHAEQIINFVQEVKDKVKGLICHCEAGISRSAAVAAAISLIINGSDKEIFDDTRYIPNMYVYRKILNLYYREETNETTDPV